VQTFSHRRGIFVETFNYVVSSLKRVDSQTIFLLFYCDNSDVFRHLTATCERLPEERSHGYVQDGASQLFPVPVSREPHQQCSASGLPQSAQWSTLVQWICFTSARPAGSVLDWCQQLLFPPKNSRCSPQIKSRSFLNEHSGLGAQGAAINNSISVYPEDGPDLVVCINQILGLLGTSTLLPAIFRHCSGRGAG
jgi:hypothetical protein